VLDLYAEFRCLTSGKPAPCANSLLGALTSYGLDGIAAVEKESMRALAMRPGPHSPEERQALLDYCGSDVAALDRLLPAMLPSIDLPRALLRGSYMGAVARMEAVGVPLDVAALTTLRRHWTAIQARLIERIDAGRGIYVGRTFRAEGFGTWLAELGIPWPRLPSGALDLSDDCFHEMGRAYPEQVSPIRELRHALSQLRLEALAVGADGRNRCLLSPFGSKTGRNQPSNARFVFGPSTWLRGLIRPAEGMALAYVDWEQQEFGIAAALSGDPGMRAAYRSGDPYLAFAQQAGAAPAHATAATHKAERERFKVLSLAVQYGMGPDALARKLDESPARGRELIGLHRAAYPRYWQWSDAVEMTAMLTGRLRAAFGWTVHTGPDANPRSLRNFPLQANGAEMMRLAAVRLTDADIRVCAPIHDAFLIEAPADRIEEAVAEARAAMAWASEIVLEGFTLRTDAKVVRWPDRYADPRGARFWDEVSDLIAETEGSARATLRVAPALPPSPLISSLMYSLEEDTPADGANRPGNDPVAARSNSPSETPAATPSTPARGTVLERPDPLAVAGTGDDAPGQGASRRLDPVAGSRLAEESDGAVLPAREPAGRADPVGGAAWVAGAGNGQTGEDPPQAGSWPGSELDGGAGPGTGPALGPDELIDGLNPLEWEAMLSPEDAARVAAEAIREWDEIVALDKAGGRGPEVPNPACSSEAVE
jgi:hypothetical protein